MKKALLDIAVRLEGREYKNEEHIRLGVVCRLLEKLGWDIWNPKEVFTEFQAIRREDASRVDVALFMPPQLLRPAVFIEVKAPGRLLPNLDAAEIQLRDYNRDNQSDISILTDGQHWRFYLSNAPGVFEHRCFEAVDLLNQAVDLEDTELALDAFLSKQAIQSGVAVDDAKKYLRRTDAERIMFEVLPLAHRDAEDDPAVSLGTCFLKRCAERGVDCSTDRALAFVRAGNGRSTGSPELLPRVKNFAKPARQIRKTTSTQIRSVQENVESYAKTVNQQMTLTNERGADARGHQLPTGKFVVVAGSVAASVTPRFKGNYLELRLKLINEGVLAPALERGTFKLLRDYEFAKSSPAAAVFGDCSLNGKIVWKP